MRQEIAFRGSYSFILIAKLREYFGGGSSDMVRLPVCTYVYLIAPMFPTFSMQMAFPFFVLFNSIAFLAFTLSAHSLPIAIDVSIPTLFVPDPSGRRTIGLVTSCLTTLALCVWTAIHMNISPTKTSSSKRFWVKLSWASLSIIAPEITLLRAIMQYETAAALRKERNA